MMTKECMQHEVCMHAGVNVRHINLFFTVIPNCGCVSWGVCIVLALINEIEIDLHAYILSVTYTAPGLHNVSHLLSNFPPECRIFFTFTNTVVIFVGRR